MADTSSTDAEFSSAVAATLSTKPAISPIDPVMSLVAARFFSPTPATAWSASATCPASSCTCAAPACMLPVAWLFRSAAVRISFSA